MPPQKLHPHERLAALAIVQLFLILYIVTWGTSDDAIAVPYTPPKEPPIEVTVTGHVWYPGTYLVDKGTTTEELLALACPKPGANLDKYTETPPFTRPRTLKITAKQEGTSSRKTLKTAPVAEFSVIEK